MTEPRIDVEGVKARLLEGRFGWTVEAETLARDALAVIEMLQSNLGIAACGESRIVKAVMTKSGCVDMELFACPRCGSKPSIQETQRSFDGMPVFAVRCIELKGCNRLVDRYPTIEGAIQAWNADHIFRHKLAAAEAREARLREALTLAREQIRMLFKQTPDEALRPIDETLRAALSTTAPETGGDT